MRMKRRRKKLQAVGRPGYVLVVTLFIIAMVAILTVGLARHSMNLAVATITSQEKLQSRWGIASCQRYALSNQRQLLNKKIWNSTSKSWDLGAVKRSDCRVQLGEQTFVIRLDDESAKLSLNHVFENSNSSKTAAVVRQFSNGADVGVALRPMADSKSRGPTEQPFESWGQVFRSNYQSNIDPAAIRQATDNLTCWSRQLSYQSASDGVLLESASQLVGSVIAHRLTRMRKTDTPRDLERALKEVNATERQTRLLSNHLTDQSTSQAVWVESISQYNRVHTLTIREGITSSIDRIHSFTW